MQEEKKPLFTSIAAAVLVLIVGFVVYGSLRHGATVVQRPGDAQNATSTQSASSTAPNVLALEVASVASSTSLYAVRAEYPRFPSMPALTQQIDAYVEGQINQFTKNVRENEQARRDTGDATNFQYTLDLSWEPAQLNGRYVSFALHVYAFDGGANGRQEVQAFNWDAQKNTAITLADLFPGDAGYLQRISEYSRNVLKGTLGDNTSDEFLNDGTKPALSSFQFFTFTDDAITFIFPKYQVAPGAAGEQKVTMPRNVTGLF